MSKYGLGLWFLNFIKTVRVPTKISEKKSREKKNKNLGKFIKKNCPLKGVREQLN